jgi:hypothetical protein
MTRKPIAPIVAKNGASVTSRWLRNGRTAAVALGLLFLMTGCFERQQVAYQEMAASTSASAPRAIAILPFHNQTDASDLSEIVREALYGHLSPRRFRDIELDVVDRTLKKTKPLDFDRPPREALRKMGARIGCDAVLVGRVTEFERLYMGIYSQLSVGAEIAIYDTRDGRRLWSDRDVARLHDGGIPLTPLAIPLSGARSGWNLRDSQVIRAVDELTRTLADRIPAPDRVERPMPAYEYELQVGAFLDQRLAMDQRHVLTSMGYPTAVRTDLHKKSIWHRVVVGPYAEEDQALDALQKLEGLLGHRPFLRRRPL